MTEPLLVPVHCDNQIDVKLVKNPEFQKKNQTLRNPNTFYSREVEGLNQLADLFTKPLKEDRFINLPERVGMGISPKEGLRERVKDDM